MNPFYHTIRSTLRLLPWLAMATLAACSMEDDPTTCLPDTGALQVTVSARQEGDLNSRAEENAKEGEFMHDLCVLFTQGNRVVLKLRPDLSGDASAGEGNLENWTSGEQTIPLGTYTVYAFANLGDERYNQWTEGEEMNTTPEDIVLNDPAGKLDFQHGSYIPMSAKETISVTADTRSVSIGLDRLVSKVRMSLKTTSTDPITVKSVSFSGYADKVSLIQGAELTTVERNGRHDIAGDITLASGSQHEFEVFYVNETREGDPFTISVTTDEHEGVTYLATTGRTDLPRNSIYPLELTLNESELSVSIEVYLLAIGVSVEDCKMEVINGEQGTYRLRIPYGGLFHLSLANTTDITYDPAGCYWENDPNNTLLSLRQENEGTNPGEEPQSPVTGTSVWGNNSAEPTQIGNEYPIYLTARWREGEKTFNRKYTILIAPEAWENFEYSIFLNSNSSGSRSLYLNKEFLNMFIRR